MTPWRRWSAVAAATIVLLLLPFLLGRLPAGDSRVAASTLLARVVTSADVPYSGYVEVDGGLNLPVGDSAFSSLADLLGGQSTMRVWWRGARDWRVDSLSLTGETDLAHTDSGLWTWDYEDNRAQWAGDGAAPPVRLPRADDLLPGTLARRLLSGALASEVTRLPNARVAGESAAGLRLRPSLPQSTVDHVDVWALPSSGLPVRVDVYDRNGNAVMRTTVLDLSAGVPPASTTAFTPPPGAFLEIGRQFDITDAIHELGPVPTPGTLAGLSRAPALTGQVESIGVYGRGVTILVAVPLPPRAAAFVSEQLGGRGAFDDAGSALTLAVGPISVRLTARSDIGARWLLTGTVTPRTLADAEAELPALGFAR